jgi:hypothetical protein
MIRFILREIINSYDTILKIADTPDLLLEGFIWWDTPMWRVQADIDHCIEDVAVVDFGTSVALRGKRGYKIYGANPNCPECFHYVEGSENVVAGVKTILQCFFERGALPDDDLIGLRVIPCLS